MVFLRFFGFPILFLGWLLYQFLVDKKTWTSIKNDALVGACFCGFATLLFVFLIK